MSELDLNKSNDVVTTTQNNGKKHVNFHGVLQ
jgi:hypothetical protein